MTITLTPELEAQVRKDAAAAGYDDVENYIQAVLWSSPDLHDWVPDDLEALRAQIEEGWQQSERGETLTEEEVRRSMEEMKAEWHKSRSAA